ncbi:MAG: methylmalonyl Co-A mutase-associated GTPase MeaB [Anaerolineae bacterium]
MELVEAVLTGERRVIARLITLIENDAEEAHTSLAQIYPHTGRAHIIGITGAPGTGKSTLANELAKAYRASGQRVGVIAVDPTSPFSGGAILGDRIRMRDLAGDPGVFVRSMATRGSLGGLARATADAIKVLDAAGFEVVIVETVGAGQSEVEIAQTAHTVVVVEAPGMGDEVQAIKAGILEIADVFAVNKADREGADRTASALEMMLDLGHTATPGRQAPCTLLHHGRLIEVAPPIDTPAARPAASTGEEAGLWNGWRPPIIKTVALRGDGIPELVEAIAEHRRYLETSQELNRRDRMRLTNELEHILRDELMKRLLDQIDPHTLAEIMTQITDRQLDPYSAAQRLITGEAIPDLAATPQATP